MKHRVQFAKTSKTMTTQSLTTLLLGAMLACAGNALAQSNDPVQLSLRLGVGGAVSGGADLLPSITGRKAIDSSDAFKGARLFSFGGGFAIDANTQVTLDFARQQGNGKTVLLRPASVTPSAPAVSARLSNDRSTSLMFGLEYAMSGLNQSGLVLGGGLGYVRTDAITAASLPVANRTLFQKTSGVTADVRLGYQFAVTDQAVIRLMASPTYLPKRDFKQANFTALGLGTVKKDSRWSVPLTIQAEFRF
jgi:hypothetical protein